MADFAVGNTGGSLRDALNELFPMTGLGNISTQFPPATGAAPFGEAPVPLPRPRPAMPGAPPGAFGGVLAGVGQNHPAGVGPVTPQQLQLMQQQLQQQGGLQGLLSGIRGSIEGFKRPELGGEFNLPVAPQTSLNFGGRVAPGGNYAARLGLSRQF